MKRSSIKNKAIKEHVMAVLHVDVVCRRLARDREATLRLGGGGGGSTISDSILGGGGTKHFFLLILYNFKDIGRARDPPPHPTP